MAVTRTSVGAAAINTAAVTAAFGTGATAGDLGLLFVETANQVLPSTPSGWTQEVQAGFGTAGAAGATMLSVYSKKSITSGDISGGVAIGDSGDHQIGRLVTYNGYDSTTPIVITEAGQDTSTASTSVSLSTAVNSTTITANDIALAIVATDRDSGTLSTNSAQTWNNIAGSRSNIINTSSASGAGGGLIVDELVPSGSQTAAVTFSETITASAWIGRLIVVKAAAAGGATLSPSTGDLSLGGKTSSIALGVSPSGGHIILGGKIPSVAVGTSLSPTNGAIVLTGKQPSPSLTVGVSPSAGHLALGGKMPGVTRTTAVDPLAGHIALGGKVPPVALTANLSPSAGHLFLSGHVAVLSLTVAVSSSAGHLVLGGKVSTVSVSSGLTPATGYLAYTGKTPTLATTLNPAVGRIALSGYTPSLDSPIVPLTGRLALTGHVPQIIALNSVVPGRPIGWIKEIPTGIWSSGAGTPGTWDKSQPARQGWASTPATGGIWKRAS